MVKPPSFDINGIKRGAWSEDEDNKLRSYVRRRGHPNWRLLPSLAGKANLSDHGLIINEIARWIKGLARCGKSCRLRWVNYLQPGLKKGNFTKEEVELIIQLHNQLGNKWSAIAAKFPGRTDNDIKNHWHAHIKKRGGLKRNRVVSRGADDQIGQSFGETNSCKNPNRQDETVAFDNIFTPAENPNAINGPDDLWTVVYGLPPLIPEEQFPEFGLCQNDTPTFSDSSDGGIMTLGDFFDFGLYPKDMSTFSDFSEGGITSPSTNSPTQESDGSFWSEDDTIFDMVLW